MHFNTPVIAKLHARLGRSDHACVVADFLQAPLHREPTTSRRVWHYYQADCPRLCHFFRRTDWSTVITDDIDHSRELLTDVVTQGRMRFIPSEVLKLHSADPVWWTPECSDAINSKQKAWKRLCLQAGDLQLQRSYKQATSTASACLRRDEDTYIEATRRKLATGDLSSREWWSAVKRDGGCERCQEIPALRDSDGTEHTSSRDKAESFARYFTAKCSLDNDLCASDFPNVRHRSDGQLDNIHFRPKVVCCELRKIVPSKATGSDGIPGRVLKQCSEDFSRPVSQLFSRAFRHGRQPLLWKLASVVPVHKKGSKSVTKNFRPISLLPILSKVMEAIANHSLMGFPERNHILSTNQYGFRQGLGTQNLLTLLHHRWSTVSAQGRAARVVAVDIAGAFDTVSHPGVLYKAQQYGVSGMLLDWLRDYLLDRSIMVVVGGQILSGWARPTVTCGDWIRRSARLST